MELNRAKLASELGLAPQLLNDRVLHKIAEDELFLHHLTVTKGHPQLQEILLKEALVQDVPMAESSTRELLRRAAASLTRWAGSGFSRVAGDEYRLRLETCRTCEHLSFPPTNLVYRLARTSEQEKTVCGLCGCDVRRKAWLSTEKCPDGRWRAWKP
jgi:hypothetical protein